MKQYELRAYDLSNLEPVKVLGSGSYGTVRLLKDKQSKEYVVGKLFLVGGNRKIIKKRLAGAKRETKILARLEHENIVRVLGTVANGDPNFEMILEYAPCGDLESFLLLDTDISLPWKIRLRFFAELAGALNYLHYHESKRPYIHGDLKPQNVLLGDLLSIKLADFGATTIVKVTGATSLTVDDNGNSQHTPLYTAPEFLRNLNEKRCRSMDVYSYGMIGYEIITRTSVFSGSQVSGDALIYMIKTEGQKPDESSIDKVDNALVENSVESIIFHTLKKIVYECWQTDADDRPKICDVKQRLDELHQNQKICKDETDIEAKRLMTHRNLNTTELPAKELLRTTPIEEQVTKESTGKRSAYCISLIISAMLVGFFSFAIRLQHSQQADITKTMTYSVIFLAINETTLNKYNIVDKNISTILHLPKTAVETRYVPNVVKVNEWVYITNFKENKCAMKLNLSESSLTWKKVQWKNKYKNKKYIAIKDSILAVGSHYDFMGRTESLVTSIAKTEDGLKFGCAQAFWLNTTTKTWTQLPSMNEPRTGHTLVLYRGLVCAIGGSPSRSAECYNFTSKEWSFLVPMKTARRDAAAVELNGELYVIGGATTWYPILTAVFELYQDPHQDVVELNSVEKYNPATNSWVQVANLLERRMYHSAGVFNGKIYVIGGRSNVVEAYDPAKNVWEFVSVLSKDRSFTRFLAV